METKTITVRFNELDLERLDQMKEFYAECWFCKKEDITTTEIIQTGLGMLHQMKYEWNLDYAKLAQDIKNGKCKYLD